MIEVEKTYSDNPFVDELIYYAKYLSLNCVVKDEEEALASETVQSLHDGQTYIACIEGKARFEMFTSFPEEILEKYIATRSNLDLMTDNYGAYLAYLDSLGVHERTKLMGDIDKLARVVYIDHYDVMMHYIQDEAGMGWVEENEELYNLCTAGTATYIELFDAIPYYTRKRVLKKYIKNIDGTDLDVVAETLENFQAYLDEREGEEEEVDNINKAFRSIFIDHYNIMLQRKYLMSANQNNWYDYIQLTEDYNNCLNNTATYETLFLLFPDDDRREAITTSLTDIPSMYIDAICESLDNLNTYFNSYTDTTLLATDKNRLNKNMRKMYIENYNLNLNFDLYNKAQDNLVGYKELHSCMPKETNKVILNNYIQEVTNINVYATDLDMLISYLSTLPREDAQYIKDNITKEMESYFVENYEEKNNYYRIIMGIPPLGEGIRYKDSLISTYDERSGTTINFGNQLIEMIPEGIYPDAHWMESELYEFDPYDISILNNYGVIDKFLELTGRGITDKRYKYINYLGDNALDIYTCRKAQNFELMSIPTVQNTEVKNMFVDKFAINRDYVIRTVFTDSHKFQSDYYNKFIIVFILINTIMDMLAGIPELIINREIFDSRSIKYLFESFGIPYYSEIPVKYQQAMLKNLNILIKYKSSTRNMVDICSLFGFEDIKVFEYWMLKGRELDENTGEFKFKEETEISYDITNMYMIYPGGNYEDPKTGVKFSRLDEYYDYDESKYTHVIHVKNDNGEIEEQRIVNSDLPVYIRVEDGFVPISQSNYYTLIKKDVEPCDVKFIKVPIKEQLTEYKNDGDYLNHYDDLTLADDTWDGGLLHDYVKNEILDYEFNAVRTKYISVETVTQLTEIAFQVSYFYNMLFDNLYSEENLTVEVPYIKINHKFKFVDIVCYLFAMMYIYHGIEDKIMYDPSQMLYIKGYYFNSDYNKILNDPHRFTQTANPMDQENIFSINEFIAREAYSYQEAFEGSRVKAFNLDADMDALDTWLHNYHGSVSKSDTNYITKAQYFTDTYNTLGLKDFVVYDVRDTDNPYYGIRDFTLWDFYSLNNSHYQKAIFNNHLLPIEYNQNIDYGFDCSLLEREKFNDLNAVEHEICTEDNEIGIVIDYTENVVYIPNEYRYAAVNKGKELTTLYNPYNKRHNYLVTHTYYIYSNGEYVPLYCTYDADGNWSTEGLIYVKDANGDYVLAKKHYYTKSDNGDGTFTYTEITNPNLITTETLIDENYNEFTRSILNLGDYFLDERDSNGNYILKPDNDYIMIYQNGVGFYALDRDRDQYSIDLVPEEDMFIRVGDSFVHLTDTDFFEPTGDPEDDYAFIEENCFVQVPGPTEYFDPEVPDVYYMRISDYYMMTEYRIDDSVHYVKDYNGNYIPITDLVDPNNCYIKINGAYYLAINNFNKFRDYTTPIRITKMYVLNDDNSYTKYNYSLTSECDPVETDNEYINESSGLFILVISNKDYETYDTTKSMVVVFNKEVSSKGQYDEDEDSIYDPEKTDNVWDENDWFYSDPSYDEHSGIGMNGENKWYYKKPGSEPTPLEEEEINYVPVGSGFYLEADSYLGTVSIEEGAKYFISMDVECNFEGKIKIGCDADSDNTDISSRMYNTKIGEMFHVSQTFIANNVSRPRLVFFIYNYDEFPIHKGDYVIVRNISIVRSHNDNYISQDIPSYDKLQQIYKYNEMCYKYLCKCMVNCDDWETYNVYKKIYDTLMTSEYNKEMFKLKDGTYAESYTQFLQSRDSVLYEKLIYFRSLDDEAMRKEIADNIIEVTYAIDDCVDTYSYGYLYSYFPAVSAAYIQQYIVKIIDFFKSWKVHLLGINTVYRFDDALENTVKILYDMKMKNTIKTLDTVYTNDTIKINPIDDVDPDGNPYLYKNYQIKVGTQINPETGLKEDIYEQCPLEYITHRATDMVSVDHGLQIIERKADCIRYRNNEIDLLLNNEDISAYPDRDGNLIISGSDGFSVELPNYLIYDNINDVDIAIQFNLNSVEKLREMLRRRDIDYATADEFMEALKAAVAEFTSPENIKRIILNQAFFDAYNASEDVEIFISNTLELGDPVNMHAAESEEESYYGIYATSYQGALADSAVQPEDITPIGSVFIRSLFN